MPDSLPGLRVRPTLVTCSARLPGQLSWPAWQALHRGPVRTSAGDSPHLPYLCAAGIDVAVEPEQAAAPLAQELRGRPDVWFAPPLPLVRELAGDADVVAGSLDPPGAALLDVVAVMDRLRSPGGCPWDAEQTHASLMPYLLEEAYEAYEALEDDDPVALREELGDVLLQVVFHTRLAQEDAGWSVDDVAAELVAKLVRRHPHVFADGTARDAGAVERSWEQIKAAEKRRTSVTDGVPLGQPALSLAAKLQRRATRLGAPVPAASGPGGELWDAVARAAAAGVDPEAALRTTARTFRDALARAEAELRAAGLDPAATGSERWAQLLPGPAAG